MYRYITNGTYPELHMNFPVQIKYHGNSTTSDGRVQIKLSYKTALLFVDGINVSSFYPEKSYSVDFIASIIADLCEDAGYEISSNDANALAQYCKEHIR
jgi:hypothetical protein